MCTFCKLPEVRILGSRPFLAVVREKSSLPSKTLTRPVKENSDGFNLLNFSFLYSTAASKSSVILDSKHFLGARLLIDSHFLPGSRDTPLNARISNNSSRHFTSAQTALPITLKNRNEEPFASFLCSSIVQRFVQFVSAIFTKFSS